MRVLVSGASGFVGSAICRRLRERGDTVERLVRGAADGVLWDPTTGRFDPAAAEGADAVVHLAGESVFSGRWNEKRKAAIRDSRVTGTRLLAEGLARLERPPRVIACASATGFYGDGGDAEQNEASPVGRGFLAEVCRDWESACAPAAERGIRVANLRIGLVLSTEGGALGKILPVFRLGLGGRVGDGRQWMSWITLGDLVRVVEWVLFDDALAGAVNAVAPHPVRNDEFTHALARVLRRPAVLPVPAIVLRLALGEMADELLLSGTRAVPKRLSERGFRFEHAQIEPALRALLED
jgi:uncharacterized protein